MRLGLSIVGLAAVAALLGCVHNVGAGRLVYDKNCVMCHGAEGRGDGDFADKLLKLPPDLTALERVNGGEFPRLRVSESIIGDGRGDHFSGAMPEFSDMAGSGAVASFQLDAVLDYLESIQE
ncbi:Cytochrome c [Shimia gijangensis]|uniref:Cytochrome c n=1 Tax=Shimia gijangensis TaxID=1470563 RepID=A0A1M6P1G6_9RHOB|nr:cytochrome c [Shimia gijangensis]SHK01781.1 Cytochrome c [Shimia gijangensis]